MAGKMAGKKDGKKWANRKHGNLKYQNENLD